MDIIFACNKDDKEFEEAICNTFTDVNVMENFSFSGMEEFLLYMVPIAALTIQIADFILTHIKDKRDDRMVIINGKKKIFKGYSKDEIIEMLENMK